MTKLFLTMPQPGETITEGTIVAWKIKPGQDVKEGDVLAEMETEKAVYEHESPFEGKVLEVLKADQSRVPVGEPIATIEVNEEKAAQYRMLGIAKDADAASSVPVESTPVKTAPQPAPVKQAPAFQKTDLKSVHSSLSLSDIKLSPYVRKLAKEYSVSQEVLSKLAEGSNDGRVSKSVMEAHVMALQSGASGFSAQKAKPRADKALSGAEGSYSVKPYSPIRQRIAENMALSKANIPHAHTGLSIDVTHLVKFREEHGKSYADKYGSKPNYLTLMQPALVETVKEFPEVNASYIEGYDGGQDEIRLFDEINLGVAVGSEKGLVIPVVKSTQDLDVKGFHDGLSERIERALKGKLKPDDLMGTTMIFNNFGFFGLNSGVQIIQYPLATTLGMGAIERCVVPISETETGIRHMSNFFLAFDHRILDGLEAGRFLSTLKKRVEAINPKNYL
jgi:2-oxoisovalerate dehydrogenase E2 component (dihydrolipoyl transacylase)